MKTEAEIYKGRKGRKKLEALEAEVERISEEFDNKYMHTREWKYISENIKWTVTARMVFVLGQRLIYFRYKGLRDYGFIRLCAQWFERNKINEPTPDDVKAMLMSIFTEELCEKLKAELEPLEFMNV